MAFGKVGIDLKGAAAVKLSFFQPNAGRIVFEMASSTGKRKRGMGKSETGVASNRVRQVLAGGIHHRCIAGSSDAIAAHELRIGHGITAVARTLLECGWGLRAVQDSSNLFV